MNVKQKNVLINSILVILIPYFLIKNNFYTTLSLYVILLTIWGLFSNRLKIKRTLIKFNSKRKDIKDLKYYYLKDVTKIIDKQERLSNISVLNDIGVLSYIIGFANIIAIDYLLNRIFGKAIIVWWVVTFSILFLLLFMMWGWISSIAFKFTTFFYCSIPIVVALFLYSFFEKYLFALPASLQLCTFLIVTGVCYSIFVMKLPLHILRNLNSKTVIVSALLTVFSTVFIQSSSIFAEIMLKNQQALLTKETIQQDASFSTEIKNVLMNADIINAINHFIRREFTLELTNTLTLMTAGLTFSFLIGGLLITLRLTKTKMVAKKNFFTLLIDPCSQITYEDLIKCAYLGGYEYENMIISNTKCLNIIIKQETKINLPSKIPYRIKVGKYFNR
ncbi:hypothetical protein C7K38_05410 [Tetragenococcus osmophilus]|uniref:Uncharacterized protein n=1 Tax=Tetragenococcus osmophilus TaxID=526944 RepID=A0AA38CYV6_9ENTE|nr:hypothetical protein [Tetragenococcus osmophilus]AYW47840.1 hypothetical protein C7K38_05410 [Tetragenococcus osmophilus]GMA53537.1 hypothetical protein GCM10025857_48940 [Alicyclobacillus contaminans]GMA72520.1 hypothetical protein GCM10025885_15690 [Tetragenococcus osmophilus]